MEDGVVIVNKDGTETKLETVPSYQDKPNSAYEGSGLYESLKDFISKSENGKEDEKKEELKVTTEEKPPVVKNEDTTVKTEKIEEKTETPVVSEEVTRLTKEFEIERTTFQDQVKKLENDLDTLKKDKSGIPADVQAFLRDARGDFEGAWSKYKTKLELPDFDLVKTQFTVGGYQARLKQHIEAVVKPQIEKEFNLDKGTFKFDFAKAEEDPMSPSARFVQLRREKEQELLSESESAKTRQAEVAGKIKALQESDLKFVADTHFKGDIKKANEVLVEMNNKTIAVVAGQAKPEEHPFSLRQVIRGFLHDRLIAQARQEERTTLLDQIRQLGISLPEKEFPTDLNKVKTTTEKKGDGKGFKIESSEFSPMLQNIESTIGK